jgi:hypothetical protein
VATDQTDETVAASKQDVGATVAVGTDPPSELGRWQFLGPDD